MLSVGYALDLLGSEFRNPIHDVAGMSATDLLQRLDALPWQKEAWESGAWVDVWGTAAYWNLARGHKNAEVSLDLLLGWLLTRVNPSSGVWGSSDDDTRLKSVNGYYRLTRGTVVQFGVTVPHVERLIDTVLHHGSDARYFAPGHANACNVLDVTLPLWLAAKQSSHRRDEATAWAQDQLTQVLQRWHPGAGMAFSAAMEGGTRRQPSLQGTEMWLAIIGNLADLLGCADSLGYWPRGVQRPEPAFALPTF
ncbi:hypothetical protein CVS30_08960 [Arthrobacter psychrolactophilus]|uniref:Uncharacterized protein n=1 Tax=Arthrobacter psychrolactophilus TaxID=92442 RepID=A0A2V5JG34_9MICC|nr:hypothetical protein [Arthrobacter psychrolactophilus]PYI38677.1 hypothetical protein CVS30_08960 [Arthrobacter psychrolactophilus]